MRLKFQKIVEKKVLMPHETAQYTRIEDIYMEMRPRQQRIGIWGERIAKDILSRQFIIGSPNIAAIEISENAIIQKQDVIIKGLLLAYIARHNNELDHQFDLSLDKLLRPVANIPNVAPSHYSEWELGLSQFKFRGSAKLTTELTPEVPRSPYTQLLHQILSADEYEEYRTFLSLLRKFIRFEKLKRFLRTEELIQTFLPYAEILVWHRLDYWAKKLDETLPFHVIEVKSSDITCDHHSKRGPISDRMGKLQREYIKRLMKLRNILRVLIAKVNFCECDHVYYWLIEVEPTG